MTAPDTLPPELEELGELLREDPPRPEPAWARSLDDRAAAGFPRPPRRSWRARLLPSRQVLLPAMGFACVLALVAAIASIAPSGDDAGSSGSSGAGGARGAGGAASSAAQSESSGSGSSIAAPRPGGRSPSSDSRRQRLQERSAALTLAARPRDIEDVADGIVHVTDAAGGFVASSTVSGGGNAGGTFELRIPTARLQKALADLSRLAHVRERSQSTVDITAEGVSARERVRELQNERIG